MPATVVEHLTDWNGLVTAINTLATNPPPGCSAQTAIPLATAPHRWSVTDIQTVQTTLKAMCNTVVFASPINPLWKQSTIDEINTALAAGWCSCNQNCCSNHVKPVQSTAFLGSWTVAGCTESLWNPPLPGSSVLKAITNAGSQASGYVYQYALAVQQMCKLEAQIVIEMAKLASLGHARDLACEGEEAPLLPCQAAIQAVNAQQDVVAAISTQRGLLEISAVALKTKANNAADLSMSLAAALASSDGSSFVNLASMIQTWYAAQTTIFGWPFIPPTNCCLPLNCSANFSLQYRYTNGPLGQNILGVQFPWASIAGGSFTPDGHPYFLYLEEAPIFGTYTCYSNHCSVGSTLPICQQTSNGQAQLLITQPQYG